MSPSLTETPILGKRTNRGATPTRRNKKRKGTTQAIGDTSAPHSDNLEESEDNSESKMLLDTEAAETPSLKKVTLVFQTSLRNQINRSSVI